MSEATAALEVRNVRRAYGSLLAVADVSFEVQPGEVFVLLGANGAGKSTVLRSIAGLQRVDSGEIRVSGLSVQTDPVEARRRLGYLPEETILYPDLTGRETLQMSGALRGMEPERVDDRAGALLRFFDLEAAADRAVSGYSRGMRRKVSVAMALLADPPTLLFDEPTGGLDPPSIALFRSVLREARARGRGVLLSTHVLAEVEGEADRIAIMEKGLLKAMGTPAELRQQADLAADSSLEDVYLLLTGRQRRSAASLFDSAVDADTDPGAAEDSSNG